MVLVGVREGNTGKGTVQHQSGSVDWDLSDEDEIRAGLLDGAVLTLLEAG